MKHFRLVVILLILTVSPYFSNVSFAQSYHIDYKMSFQTTIVNKGSVDFDLTSNAFTDPCIPLFAQNALQNVRLSQSSHPLRAGIDQDGNGNGVFQIQPILRKGQTLTLGVQYLASVYLTQQRELWQSHPFTISDSGAVTDIPQALVDSFCKANGPWRLNDSEESWKSILDLASRLAVGEFKILAILVKYVDWIGKNIKYPQSRRDRIFLPNETLTYLEGDCDEQSNLLISMLRHSGVPAYLQTGALYLPARERRSTLLDGHLVSSMNSVGWHAWAMVYVPPWGWLPVDMTIGYRPESALDAIVHSAPATLSAIIANSFTTSDYVSEGNVAASELQRTGIEIIEVQSIEQTAVPPAQDMFPVLITVSALVLFGVTILVIYLAERARRRTHSLSN